MAKPCNVNTAARLSQIRTSFHYRDQLEGLIWKQLNMFGTFNGLTSQALITRECVLKLSLQCVVNVKRSTRITSDPLLVRYFASALPVWRSNPLLSIL